MSIQKGHLYLEGYSYINCINNASDTLGDIRFRVDSISKNFLMEKCVVSSSDKGGGTWELYNPKIVSKEHTTGSIPIWKDNYLYKSPIALESETSSNYIDYVLSEGGFINDYSLLYDIYGDNTISRVVINSGLRITAIPNSAGNFLTNVNGVISQRTPSEVLSDLGALTEVNWGDIGGILSNQTDLQDALDLKENAFSASTASKFFSWDKTWRSIDYSYLINTPDLTSLGYWVPFSSGIRSENGLIAIKDSAGANEEMVLGYDYYGGDYALTVADGISNGKLISGYDSVSGDYRYGGEFGVPYVTIKDSRLIVNQVSSDSQIRTWYIANPYYADNLETTPSAHVLLYDDGITAYRAVLHEFENPYATQGAVWVAGNLDLQLSGRDRITALSYVLGTDGTKVIERTVANFISDNSLLSATLVNKGDILVYNGTSLQRLPLGLEDQVLTVVSGETLGILWQDPTSLYWGKDANSVVYALSDGDSIGLKVGATVYQALAMPNSTSFVLGNGGGNMTGINNTIIGNGAAPNITSGYQNIIAGTGAGNDLTTGYQNVLLGYLAGGDIVSGYGNMAFGTTALWKATGNNNVGIGAGSGFNLVTGSNNIYIGDATGQAIESRMLYVANIVKANMSLTSSERYFEILDANVIADTFNGVALTNGGSSAKFLAEDGIYYVVDSGGGMTNPMTTTGDIIYQNSSGNPARLGATTNGYILSLVSGIPAWVAPSVQSHGDHTGEVTSSGLATTLNKTAISNRTAYTTLATSDYLLLYQTTGDTLYKIAISTLIKDTPANGQTQYGISSNWAYAHSNTFGNEAHVPAEPSTDATLKYLRGDGVWAIPAGGSGGGMVNPMTTAGDMIYYGSSNPSRLPIGSNGGEILQTVSGYPSWVTISGEGTLSSGGYFSITKEAVMNRTTQLPGDNTYILGATTGGYNKFTVASLASYILPLVDEGDFIIGNELGNAERFAKNNTYIKSVITQVLKTEITTETITEWTPFKFTSLTDTPPLSGNAGKILGVNSSGTGLLWVSPSTNSVELTGAVIGSGTGTVPTAYNETVPVNKGGTGTTFYNIGEMLVATGASTLSKFRSPSSIDSSSDPAVLQQYWSGSIPTTYMAKLPKITSISGATLTGHIYGSGTITIDGGVGGDSLWSYNNVDGFIVPAAGDPNVDVDIMLNNGKKLLPGTALTSDIGAVDKEFRYAYLRDIYFGSSQSWWIKDTGETRFNLMNTYTGKIEHLEIKDSGGSTKWTIELDSSNHLRFKYLGVTKATLETNGNMKFFE